MIEREITWRRLDVPGHERARLDRMADGWRLSGSASFEWQGASCALDYDIACDEGWHTRTCRVSGQVGETPIAIEIAVDAAQRWTMNGAACPAVDAVIDIDLNFSPSTNLLPIRRLDLAPGESAAVTAAWLRFPSFTLEPFAQTYSRLDAQTYRYESAGGAFTRDLTVDLSGFPLLYPGVWCADESEK